MGAHQVGRPAKQQAGGQPVLTRDFATSVLEILGLVAITCGVWQIFVPAAWIVGGLGLVLLGYFAGRPPVVVAVPAGRDQ